MISALVFMVIDFVLNSDLKLNQLIAIQKQDFYTQQYSYHLLKFDFINSPNISKLPRFLPTHGSGVFDDQEANPLRID